MYTIFEENIEAGEEYTSEFKAELDRRHAEYKKDGKTISREEMNDQIRKMLLTKRCL